MKASVYTLGCRANQAQSEAHKAQLLSAGYQLVKFSEPVDLCLINTCTVTADADRRSRQVIRQALNRAKKVMVTGCYSRLQAERLKTLFPTIELTPTPPLNSLTKRAQPQIRANLMIEDGCANFCSYCIVPFARGPVTSKSPAQIITEAKDLICQGVKEIVLTGINLGAYQYNLPNIISRLALVKGLERLRLSSLEPKYLTKELIEHLSKTPKFCRHLHLPLQSGDNTILKAMNRNYTREAYLKLITDLRRAMPDWAISTDIIVGFPGESPRHFAQTVKLVKEVGFSRLHIFPYSKREGTAAVHFPHQVAASVIKQRSRLLHCLKEQQMRRFARQYLGQAVEILVEQIGQGLTRDFVRVVYPGNKQEVGTVKKVVISGVKADYCLSAQIPL